MLRMTLSSFFYVHVTHTTHGPANLNFNLDRLCQNKIRNGLQCLGRVGLGMYVIRRSNFSSFPVTIPVSAFNTTMASMLQCPLVASLRNQSVNNPEAVLTELKNLLSVSGAKFKTLSAGQRHQLRELH